MRGFGRVAPPRRGWSVVLGGLILLLAALPALAQGEGVYEQDAGLSYTLDPVFEQNGVDGQLLGLQGSYTLYGFEPFAAVGYGLDSGAWRYRAGLGWRDVSLEWHDWPEAAVLGREGEVGYSLESEMENSHSALRFAQLWPTQEEGVGPQVGYFHSTSSYRLTGAFDSSLSYSGDTTIGFLTDGRKFESMSHRVKARWGDFRLNFSAGTSSNEAQLPGFEFTQGMGSYDEPLKGHSFWRIRPERRALLLSVPIPLSQLFGDSPYYAPTLPDTALNVEASAFGEMLYVQPNPTPLDADPNTVDAQSRLGWGLGLVFSLSGFDFEVRFDLFFNADGKMAPLFG